MPAGDTGTTLARSTTRVRCAPSRRGTRRACACVHRAYSTQQSSVVMHTHVHTHTRTHLLCTEMCLHTEAVHTLAHTACAPCTHMHTHA